jgi:putative transposase
MQAEKASFPISVMCRALSASRSGFYAAAQRGPSHRTLLDESLGASIRDIYFSSRATYGSPRIHAELRNRGQHTARKRVARLMVAQGLQARRRKRFRCTTDSKHSFPVAPNLLMRNFTTDQPNKVWVGDIKAIWTTEGWLYLAVLIDLFSRMVVGWAMDSHMRTDLVLRALQLAVRRRFPNHGLIHHSDRGSQYASHDYRNALAKLGMTCSMSRKGDCWDNAVAESFFATLQNELIAFSSWSTRTQAKTAIFDYIEVFYNRRRNHSALGYQSPLNYETLAVTAAEVAA